MNTATSGSAVRRDPNPLYRLIQRATGATKPDLPRIENIMREEN